jgi:hypothetical protein
METGRKRLTTFQSYPELLQIRRRFWMYIPSISAGSASLNQDQTAIEFGEHAGEQTVSACAFVIIYFAND